MNYVFIFELHIHSFWVSDAVWAQSNQIQLV